MYNDPSSLSAPTSSASLNMLLIPAAHVSDLVLGYSVISSPDNGSMLNPFEVPLDSRLFVRERFCYDPSARHMVIVLNALSDAVTGIVSIEWLDDSRRQRLFFTVPNEEYGFYNLPSTVLAIMTHVEHKISSDSSDIFTAHTDEGDGPDLVRSANPGIRDASVDSFVDARDEADMVLGGVTADMLHGLDDLLGLSGEGDTSGDAMNNVIAGSTEEGITEGWSIGATGTCNGMEVVSDTLAKGKQLAVKGKARVNRGEKASVGPFDMKDLFSALAGLEDVLEGQFYAPKLSRDVLDPSTGEILSRTSGAMTANLTKSDAYSFKVFIDATAQAYYATALAVSTDRMLTYPGEKRNSRRNGQERGAGERKRLRVSVEEADMEEDEDESSKVRNSEEWRVDTLTESAYGDTRDQEGTAQNVEVIKAAKVEARKQRNRESAARSNQRKKERIEADEGELERLKIRLKELRKIRKRLELENEHLRQRLM